MATADRYRYNFMNFQIAAIYKSKTQPVVSIGGGNGSGLFNRPCGVVVDYKTDNIYVADSKNDRVQVFNREGKYLFTFGDRDGLGKMKYPCYIAISREKVFLSVDKEACLLVYDLYGNFITQIGSRDNLTHSFLYPQPLAISEIYEEIYVSDYTNGIVHVYQHSYPFKYKFGEFISIKEIQLTKKYIFIFSSEFPYLCTFNYNLIQVKNPVSNALFKALNYPYGFKIDCFGSFIITDYHRDRVVIFDKQGTFLHIIRQQIYCPTGVTQDSKGRIIVVGDNHRLVIY